MRAADAALLPFLEAGDEAESQRHLERLVRELAEPLIRATIRRKWRLSPHGGPARPLTHVEQDAEEVRREVIAHLLSRLQGMKSEPRLDIIADLRPYVAVATNRTCDRHMRQKHPERARLQNRLRYFLSHQPGFALWCGAHGAWLGGLAAWRGLPAVAPGPGLQAWHESPGRTGGHTGPPHREHASTAELGPLLTELFHAAGCPLELDALVAIVADVCDVRECVVQSASPDDAESPYDRVADPTADVAATVDQRVYLQRLWTEIGALPPRQRAAVLLNLRDHQGRGVIALLPITGVARLRQIAAALEIPAEEFAPLWNDLPLEDAAIARLLGITRQQVINLRKVARERLARRMQVFDREI
jgi:hypothetical protein